MSILPGRTPLLLLLVVVMMVTTAANATILLPPPIVGVNDAALVIIQGADVYPEQYRELG